MKKRAEGMNDWRLLYWDPLLGQAAYCTDAGVLKRDERKSNRPRFVG